MDNLTPHVRKAEPTSRIRAPPVAFKLAYPRDPTLLNSSNLVMGWDFTDLIESSGYLSFTAWAHRTGIAADSIEAHGPK